MPLTDLENKSLGAYLPPPQQKAWQFSDFMQSIGRDFVPQPQLDLLKYHADAPENLTLYAAGNIDVLKLPSIAIVGTREASESGLVRASKLAQQLAEAGITIVSGLAKGVDTAALRGAIAAKGHIAAVIGTPLTQAYPSENKKLQEHIWREGLLLSPFAIGSAVNRQNFPIRNRVMAAISDATVIVEASDSSGTLHQAAECQRLGRKLFIMKSVLDNKNLKWPAKFLNHKNTIILDKAEQIISFLGVQDGKKIPLVYSYSQSYRNRSCRHI